MASFVILVVRCCYIGAQTKISIKGHLIGFAASRRARLNVSIRSTRRAEGCPYNLYEIGDHVNWLQEDLADPMLRHIRRRKVDNMRELKYFLADKGRAPRLVSVEAVGGVAARILLSSGNAKQRET